MKYAIALLAVMGVFAVGAAGQERGQSGEVSGTLATVQIPQSVLAGGKPLPAGRYEVRLTNRHRAPLPGQSPDAERWVEFVANGQVVAEESAVVLHDGDLPAIGASSTPSGDGTRVDMLKGGEFLRIAVKRAAERYLIYLPVAP